MLQLLKEGHIVHALGRDEKALDELKNKIPEEYKKRLWVQKLDIIPENKQQVADYLQENHIEIIIHAAGQASVGKSYKEVEAYEKEHGASYTQNPEIVRHTETGIANIQTTEVLLEALAELRFTRRRPHFHLVSTGDVFSQFSNNTINEQSERGPNTPYGQSKQYAEERLQESVKKGNITGSVSYGPLIFGVDQRPIALIPIITQKFLDNEPVILRGDPNRATDAIDVDDFAKILVNISTRISPKSLDQYVISGHRTTIGELFELVADAIEKYTGTRPFYEIDPKEQLPSDKPIDQSYVKEAFPTVYEHLTSLREVIDKAVKQQVMNREEDLIHSLNHA